MSTAFSSPAMDMMPHDEELSRCAELRSEEWTVLSSVYPEYTTLSSVPQATEQSSTTVRLEIPVEIDEQQIEITCEGVPSHEEQRVLLSLSNLPPLIISLLLPPSYPLREIPVIVQLHAVNGWLDPADIQRIANKLQKMWEEDLEIGSGSLWKSCEWIKGATFFEELGLSEAPQLRLVHPKPNLLAERLKAHDDNVKSSLFSHSKFDCQICLSSIKGSQCIRLNCGHVFCRPCLTGFWSLHIQEGDIDRVMCADPRCVKENRAVTEEEVMRVVTAAEVQRWSTLKKKRALEKDPGLVYCPITFCQGPCPSPQTQQGEMVAVDDVMMRRKHLSLRSCDNCGFSFCILCKRSWHGLAPCSSNITAKFLEEYMSLDEAHPERLALERRFGKAQLVRLVEKIKEDLENQQWLERSTTKCPNCQISVEKSVGCNHMTCARCSTHFCYLCGLKLPGDRPYDHFSARGPCKGQLFQMANWEPDEDELWALAND